LASRAVVYLVGGLDRCNISDFTENGWCQSHGLETTCMDMLQGLQRWQRHHLYLSMLRRLRVPYYSGIVAGVGHDHSLMFHSSVGSQAIFGELPSIERDQSKQSRWKF
jgi:hypothetical protein